MAKMLPKWYTEYESGAWNQWPAPPVDSNWLLVENPHDYNNPRTRVLHGISFHALLFGDVLMGWGHVPRWDCLNGWTCRKGLELITEDTLW